jgi:hypothetical protein
MHRTTTISRIGVFTFLLLSGIRTHAAPIVFSSAGVSPADILGEVNAFRAALGAVNPNVAGSFGTGRREINLDGVPDALATPK